MPNIAIKKYQLGKLCSSAKYVNNNPRKTNSPINNIPTSEIADKLLINIDDVRNKNVNKGIKKIKPYNIKAIQEPNIPIEKIFSKLSVP